MSLLFIQVVVHLANISGVDCALSFFDKTYTISKALTTNSHAKEDVLSAAEKYHCAFIQELDLGKYQHL
jgi:hypothetical protein